MARLAGKLGLVTGASRGIGKGIALALAKEGMKVVVTARTMERNADETGLPGSLAETQAEIEAAGGTCVAMPCDHTDDVAVERVFSEIAGSGDKLDLLVNNAWGGYETMYAPSGEYVWARKFWEQPISQWDRMFGAGVRAAWVASHHAARLMTAQRSGLIVNLSYWAAKAYSGNTCYGVSKAATDRLTTDCAYELKDFGVAVVSLYPGLVRTERVMFAADYLDLSNSESPEFQGRVITGLLADVDPMSYSGQTIVSARLAEDLGIVDIDGRHPRPLTLDEGL